MMPLSALKRRLYFVGFTLLFLIVVPCALLFAGGWRYKENFGFVRTGGIFVSVPYSDATILVDGAPAGTSSFLNHGFYISNLASSAYVIQVDKVGYRPWSKVLIVEPQIVTDAQTVLIPEEIEPIKLVVGTSATGTRSVSASEYASFTAVFKESVASSTAKDAVRGSMAADIENGDVYVHWTQPSVREPEIFCGRPSYCADTIEIEHTKQKAISAVFFARGIVYSTREGGVFFSEVDVRPTVVVASLFPQAGADARIVNGALIVKYGKEFYEIDGL